MNNCWRLLPVLLPVLASAQQDTLPIPNMIEGHRFTLDASAGYDSNVLRNELVVGIYRGGTLGREVRQNTMNGMGGQNRAGYELGGTATLAWGDSLFGHSAWMPRFSLTYQSVMGVRFATDVYALSFFGNAGYEDRTAHLGPSDFEQVSYQSFGLGVEGRNSGTFIELAVVNGQSLNAGHIQQADLYTAPYGTSLELQLNGEYHRSDTARNSFNNGIGAAINMQWRHRFQLFRSPVMFSIGVADLGFIAWNSNALSVKKDSTIRYEGIEVTDILDLDGLLVDRTSLQDSLGLGYSKGSFMRVLPARVEARLGAGKFHKRSHFMGLSPYELSVDYRYLPGYRPHATIIRNVVFTKCMAASIGAGYGSFGDFRAMAGLMGMLGKNFRIGLYTPNAVGFFSDQAYGKAVAVQVEASW